VSESQFKFVLVEKEETSQHGPARHPDSLDQYDYSTPPSKDWEKDQELLKEIEESAAANDLQQSTETERDSGLLVSDGSRQFYGGSVSWTEVLHIIAYTGVAVGGFATFVDHVLSAAVHWRSLRQDRSIRIDVQGTAIEIADGDTALQVMGKITDALKDKDSKQPS